jgi:hypothetical protein
MGSAAMFGPALLGCVRESLSDWHTFGWLGSSDGSRGCRSESCGPRSKYSDSQSKCETPTGHPIYPGKIGAFDTFLDGARLKFITLGALWLSSTLPSN